MITTKRETKKRIYKEKPSNERQIMPLAKRSNYIELCNFRGETDKKQFIESFDDTLKVLSINKKNEIIQNAANIGMVIFILAGLMYVIGNGVDTQAVINNTTLSYKIASQVIRFANNPIIGIFVIIGTILCSVGLTANSEQEKGKKSKEFVLAWKIFNEIDTKNKQATVEELQIMQTKKFQKEIRSCRKLGLKAFSIASKEGHKKRLEEKEREKVEKETYNLRKEVYERV